MKKLISIFTITLLLAFLLCGCSVPKKNYTSIEDYYNCNKTIINGVMKIVKVYCDDDMDYDIQFKENNIIIQFTVDDIEKSEVSEKYFKDYLYQQKDDMFEFAQNMKEAAKIDEECTIVIIMNNDKNEKLLEMSFSSDNTTSEDDSLNNSTTAEDKNDSNYNDDSASSKDNEYEDSKDTQDDFLNNSDLSGSVDDMNYSIDIDGSTICLNFVMDLPNNQEVKDMLSDYINGAKGELLQNAEQLNGLYDSLRITVKNNDGEVLYEQDFSLDSKSL